jgi:hypothetical protein
MSESFALGFGNLGQTVYENPSYAVQVGMPPHKEGDFFYLTYLIVNKANGVVENFNNILRAAQDNADGMHEYMISPKQTAEIVGSEEKQGSLFN